jgi:hypothetical protein
VENYFNYFTEIEEHFQRRRGTLLILTALDWALIETWKDAGVPLEAVLRGIDASFDKWERRPTRTRKVNSLAYCSQEVLAAAEDMKEAAVGVAAPAPEPTGIDQQEIAAFFQKNALQLEKSQIPATVAPLVKEQTETLRELAASLRGGAVANPEDLERRLTVMEEKLMAALLTASPDDQIVEVRAEADRELAPYRRNMSGPQIEQLMRQYINKKLLERYALPRLSLFYM